MEQVPHMYQLYFAGGESLIIDEHYDLLEECIKQGYAKNIELRYNSNAVEWRDDLFDLWAEFKRVRFHYSIDAHGEHNDYIRYPNTMGTKKRYSFVGQYCTTSRSYYSYYNNGKQCSVYNEFGPSGK